MSARLLFATLLAAAWLACGAEKSSVPSGDGSAGPPDGGAAEPSSDALGGPTDAVEADGVAIPKEPQRSGDPKKGYTALVNEGYVSVGIPWSGFSLAMTALEPRDALPGRLGDNARVGYSFNVSTREDGMRIASPSCLECHAFTLPLDGKLFVGLGRPVHAPAVPSGVGVLPGVISLGLKSAAEVAAFQTYAARLLITQEAGTLTASAALASHHDPKSLAWEDAARFNATTGLAGWVDVPPWWRTRKKNALYANGSGRGDHAHHMMNMTLFSVASVAEAQRLDAMFVDIEAYLHSIEPPAFPLPIDRTLTERGQTVFVGHCAKCHGTYGANEWYPNLIIPLERVGTDPELAKRFWMNGFGADWFASAAVYGTLGSRFERTDGYVAPPLDGVWATAPFFHNGSVPTLEGVLDSSKRPASWTMRFEDGDFDATAVGWRGVGVGVAFDTSLPGRSNAGHTFGDALEAADRRALLEYLKTL